MQCKSSINIGTQFKIILPVKIKHTFDKEKHSSVLNPRDEEVCFFKNKQDTGDLRKPKQSVSEPYNNISFSDAIYKSINDLQLLNKNIIKDSMEDVSLGGFQRASEFEEKKLSYDSKEMLLESNSIIHEHDSEYSQEQELLNSCKSEHNDQIISSARPIIH